MQPEWKRRRSLWDISKGYPPLLELSEQMTQPWKGQTHTSWSRNVQTWEGAGAWAPTVAQKCLCNRSRKRNPELRATMSAWEWWKEFGRQHAGSFTQTDLGEEDSIVQWYERACRAYWRIRPTRCPATVVWLVGKQQLLHVVRCQC
jgi:hypothetical protein